MAVALGLSAPLQQSGEFWVARDPWRRLRVHRGTGAWAFETVPGRACSDVAAELGPGEELNCPPSSGGDPGSAVGGVLRSLGLQPVAQQGGRDELWVEVDPVVDGAQTDGFTTGVLHSDSGEVLRATGWLSSTVEGSNYALISSQEAFSKLFRDTSTCPFTDLTCEPGELAITGARLGSVLAVGRSGPLLVPAWFFEGSASPVPALAPGQLDIDVPPPGYWSRSGGALTALSQARLHRLPE